MAHIRDLENKDTQNIDISPEIIAVIASKAAMKTNGVAAMSGKMQQIANILGREHQSKGIKVSIEQSKLFIDVYVIISYGFRIPEVAWEIQKNIKNDIESMTEAEVGEVNIHIQGVNTDSI